MIKLITQGDIVKGMITFMYHVAWWLSNCKFMLKMVPLTNKSGFIA